MLSDTKARKLKASDKPISDTMIRGLYLFPAAENGKGKWILRFHSPETGKRRDMGLGTYPLVAIRDARRKAFELRQQIEDGIDPIEERRRQEEADRRHRAVPTFEQAARTLHADLAPGFRNRKHRDQWLNTVQDHVFAKIGKKPVNELTPQDFAGCLKSIWLKKPETASRIRQRCDAVMNWCAAQGYIMASPVGVVDKLLPRQPGKRERVAHHPAMPWRDVPAFFLAALRTQPVTLSKLMLEILILTAVRSGELRHMTWDEVDLEKAVWTIPASRMKAKSVHRVPLAPRVVTLLRLLKPRREGLCQEKRPGGPGLLHFAGESNLVFPSRNGTATSDMILTKLLRDRKVASDVPGRHATAHGFRSSFRDWASENGYARDLAERALAHTISNAAEAAYHRTDLLEQRRSMMEAWAHFCTGQCMVVE